MFAKIYSSSCGHLVKGLFNLQLRDSDELEFNYDEVHISEAALSKSYEDASLLEDLSADANEAFQNAENSLQSQAQRENLGFFAANLRNSQDRVRHFQVHGLSNLFLYWNMLHAAQLSSFCVFFPQSRPRQTSPKHSWLAHLRNSSGLMSILLFWLVAVRKCFCTSRFMRYRILQAMYQLDGEFESVQPSLRTPASYFARWESFDSDTGANLKQDSQQVQHASTATFSYLDVLASYTFY